MAVSGTRKLRAVSPPESVTLALADMPGSSPERFSSRATLTGTVLADPDAVPISVMRPEQPQPGTVETRTVAGAPTEILDIMLSGTERSTSSAASELTRKSAFPLAISSNGSRSRVAMTPSKGARRIVSARSFSTLPRRERAGFNSLAAESKAATARSMAAFAT